MENHVKTQHYRKKRDKKAKEKENFEEPASDADADELAAIREVDPQRFDL